VQLTIAEQNLAEILAVMVVGSIAAQEYSSHAKWPICENMT